MRVLAFETTDLVINGLISALSVSGNHCLFLKQTKPIFDGLYEFRPDLILLQPHQITDETREACSRFNIQTVCIGAETAEYQSYIPNPAANLAQLVGKNDNRLYCDMSYILLSDPDTLCLSFIEQFTYPHYTKYVKMFGAELPYVNYVGRITSMAQIGNILASSRVLIDHYNTLILDAWINYCICIPYRSNPLMFPEELFGRYEEVSELLPIIEDFKASRLEKGAEIIKWIMENNTYYHRAAELLNKIERKKEATQCLKSLPKLA